MKNVVYISGRFIARIPIFIPYWSIATLATGAESDTSRIDAFLQEMQVQLDEFVPDSVEAVTEMALLPASAGTSLLFISLILILKILII